MAELKTILTAKSEMAPELAKAQAQVTDYAEGIQDKVTGTAKVTEKAFDTAGLKSAASIGRIGKASVMLANVAGAEFGAVGRALSGLAAIASNAAYQFQGMTQAAIAAKAASLGAMAVSPVGLTVIAAMTVALIAYAVAMADIRETMEDIDDTNQRMLGYSERRNRLLQMEVELRGIILRRVGEQEAADKEALLAQGRTTRAAIVTQREKDLAGLKEATEKKFGWLGGATTAKIEAGIADYMTKRAKEGMKLTEQQAIEELQAKKGIGGLSGSQLRDLQQYEEYARQRRDIYETAAAALAASHEIENEKIIDIDTEYAEKEIAAAQKTADDLKRIQEESIDEGLRFAKDKERAFEQMWDEEDRRERAGLTDQKDAASKLYHTQAETAAMLADQMGDTAQAATIRINATYAEQILAAKAAGDAMLAAALEAQLGIALSGIKGERPEAFRARFEGLTDAWSRIQAAAASPGKGKEPASADLQKESVTKQGEANKTLDEIKKILADLNVGLGD